MTFDKDKADQAHAAATATADDTATESRRAAQAAVARLVAANRRMRTWVVALTVLCVAAVGVIGYLGTAVTDAVDLLRRRTPIIAFIDDGVAHQTCLGDVSARYDVALGRALVLSTGARDAAFDASVAQLHHATEDMGRITELCPPPVIPPEHEENE